jgi:hypothetical protein
MNTMFHVLIDTCVWLDLAADPRQRAMLDTLDAFISLGHIHLIVPRLVVDEFARNRDRIGKAGAKGISSQVQQVKEAIRALELNGRRKRTLLAGLEDIRHKVPQMGGGAELALRLIEGKFKKADIVETTDAVKLAAAERALTRKAPCHHDNKNSIGDALILETYIEQVRNGAGRDRFAFVSHNKHDFSGTDPRQPHPDIASHFTKIRSLYFVNLSELLARIDSSALSEIQYEQAWSEEPRPPSELWMAEAMLAKQVWYNRHKNREYDIEHGKLKIVSREEWEKGARNNQDEIIDDIWKGALKAAERTERELGPDNIGPWTDFEWGMINGKLSALRWMLGDEWDMLDT